MSVTFIIKEPYLRVDTSIQFMANYTLPPLTYGHLGRSTIWQPSASLKNL